jgi:hypothetical protein
MSFRRRRSGRTSRDRAGHGNAGRTVQGAVREHHEGIAGEPLGVVDVILAGESAVDGLPQTPRPEAR